MSGDDRVPYPIVRAGAAHPDDGLARRTIDAFQWWLAQPHEPAPTSAVNGTGAVAACERAFSGLHENRPALLLPSATYALRTALACLGVGPGSEVLVPALDWPSTWQAVVSLAATPVAVPVDRRTLTIAPSAAQAARTARTHAVVACHLHGVAADVPALRRLLPGLPIVEDAAGALGSTLDGHPVGTFGDFAVLSLGPNKSIDAGEGGVLLAADQRRRTAAIAGTAHPLRKNLSGLDPSTSFDALSIRPHPMTAVLALHALCLWDADSGRRAHQAAADALAAESGSSVLGLDDRRSNVQRSVPVLGAPGAAGACFGSVSGASNLARKSTRAHDRAERLLRSVRLLPTRPLTGTLQPEDAGVGQTGRDARQWHSRQAATTTTSTTKTPSPSISTQRSTGRTTGTGVPPSTRTCGISTTAGCAVTSPPRPKPPE